MRGSGVRLLAGDRRGRRLPVPAGVRPSSARLREALFSIWAPRLAGCRFLDLFAGTGAVGLEALSRGAAEALFVEQAPRVLAALERSVGELAAGRGEVRRLRLPEVLARPPAQRFDLAFADPPYRFTAHRKLLEGLEGWLTETGELALEHPARLEPELAPGWHRLDRRAYGDSCLTFLGREV